MPRYGSAATRLSVLPDRVSPALTHEAAAVGSEMTFEVATLDHWDRVRVNGLLNEYTSCSV